MTINGGKIDIYDLLCEKKQALDLILEIAVSQKVLLGNEDSDALLAAIDKRKKLILQIDEINRQIQDSGIKTSQDYKSEKVQSVLGIINNILIKITELDKENIKTVEDQLEGIKSQIRSVKNDKNRINSYQNITDKSDGIYFDKKK